MDAASSAPCLFKTINRYGNNRHLNVRGQNRRALLECLRLAGNAAFAFGIQHQRFSLPKAISSSAHGGNEVGIGIDGDELHGARNSPADAAAEDFARADVEHLAKDSKREVTHDKRCIHEALMIRREDERTIFGNVFEPADFNSIENLA